jgi:hypothetical protein
MSAKSEKILIWLLFVILTIALLLALSLPLIPAKAEAPASYTQFIPAVTYGCQPWQRTVNNICVDRGD